MAYVMQLGAVAVEAGIRIDRLAPPDPGSAQDSDYYKPHERSPEPAWLPVKRPGLVPTKGPYVAAPVSTSIPAPVLAPSPVFAPVFAPVSAPVSAPGALFRACIRHPGWCIGLALGAGYVLGRTLR